MALSVFSSEPVKRSDILSVSPNDVVVKEELRGRKFRPSDEDIIEMAMSIFDHGQRQPIEVRRQTIGENKNMLVTTSGFTRTAAVRLIREGFTGTDDQFRQDAEYMLKVMVVDCDDKKAFLNNIIENAHRNGTSDIDNAHNQQELREKYGYSDADIARLYQYKQQNKVGILRKLLQLTEDEQKLVHLGLMPVSTAVELLALPAEERAALIATIQDGDATQKIRGSVVVEAIRNKVLADTDEDAASKTAVAVDPSKFKPRSMAAVKKFFDKQIEGEGTDPAIVRFSKDFLKYLAGKTTDKAFTNALQRLLEAEATEVVASEEEEEAA